MAKKNDGYRGKRDGMGVYAGIEEEKRRGIIGARCAATGAANFHHFITDLTVFGRLVSFFFPQPKLQFLNSNGCVKTSAFGL